MRGLCSEVVMVIMKWWWTDSIDLPSSHHTKISESCSSSGEWVFMNLMGL